MRAWWFRAAVLSLFLPLLAAHPAAAQPRPAFAIGGQAGTECPPVRGPISTWPYRPERQTAPPACR
jgi:hypothetical protein